MVEIQNPKIIDEISEKIKESNLNTLPKQLGNSVIPVIEVGNNIDEHYFKSFSRTTTTSGLLLFTTPSDKDFYLTAVRLSLQANSTSDSTSCYIKANVNGVNTYLIAIPKLTTTATSENLSFTFSKPVKIDRNTNVTFVSSFTVGAQSAEGAIVGFTVDSLQK